MIGRCPPARLTHTVVVAVCLTVLAACGSAHGDGPAAPPIVPPVVPPPVVPLVSVRFASATVVDTIEAAVAEPLVAEVRDAENRTRAGVVVRFAVVAGDISGALSPLRVAATGDGPADSVVSVTTDQNGQARTFVVLGRRAGAYAVAVSAAGVGAGDTAHVSVTPGRPVLLVVGVRDTLVTRGRALAVPVQAADRGGNAVPVSLTLRSTDGSCTLIGATIGAEAVGRCTVLASAGALVDSIHATVVPTATLYGLAKDERDPSRGARLVSFDLDGANYHEIADFVAPSFANDPGPVAISPGRQWAAVFFGFGDYSTHITLVDPTGRTQPFAPTAAPSLYQNWPRFSPDGQWLYYSARAAPNEAFSVWRAYTNGAGAERVTPLESGYGWGSNYADITPDGRSLVYTDGRLYLRAMDLATRRIRALPSDAAPEQSYVLRISPDGTRVAYLFDAGAQPGLHVARIDGSGGRLLTAELHPTLNDFSLDWTPDGQWILARQRVVTAFPNGVTTSAPKDWVLVNASTGALLPLPYKVDMWTLSVAR